jgi:hypothetical protein
MYYDFFLYMYNISYPLYHHVYVLIKKILQKNPFCELW